MHLDADLGFQVTDGPNAPLNRPSHFHRSNDGLLLGAVAQGDQCATGFRPKRSVATPIKMAGSEYRPAVAIQGR